MVNATTTNDMNVIGYIGRKPPLRYISKGFIGGIPATASAAGLLSVREAALDP